MMFTTDHGVSFSVTDPLELERFKLLKNINTAWQYFVTGFLLRDCEYVAYYMGALAHLMANAVYYPHTLHGLDLDLIGQRPLMDYVGRLTYTKYSLRTPMDFFDINQPRAAFDQSDLIPPTEGAYMACIDTRYGNAYDDFDWVSDAYLYADELYDIFNTVSPWPADLNECDLWNRATRTQLTAQNPLWGDYFRTIEHQLNTAIYYTASAINFLMWDNFVNCDCTGEIAEDGIINYIHQEEADWVANQEGPWTRDWLDKYNLANLTSMLGLVMALISISVVKKLEMIFVF